MMSLWSLILIASVAIGLFLMSLLVTNSKTNPRATYLFSGLLLVLTATNFDNWLYASGSWKDFVMLVGFSRASILLVGPLIYLYANAIVIRDFRLRPAHLFHAAPYVVAYTLIFPQLYLYGEEFKSGYISVPFVSGAPLNVVGRLVFMGYLVQIAIYLMMTLTLVRRGLQSEERVNLVVPTEERLQWIKKLAVVLSLCFLALSVPLLWTIVTARYHPEINYSITTVYSLLTYYLGVAVIRSEHLVLPGFVRKYESLTVTDEQMKASVAKLVELLTVQKIFLNPDLTLSKTAEMIGVPAGYLSKYINETYRKGFPDLINQYRVEELKMRLTDSKSKNLTILGLAMEVGFNSKSSFNAAFKRVTGQSPSGYKKTQHLQN